jgi:Ca-activated chloride channel family protein
VNRVLLLTDGQANVGITEPVKILEEVRKRAGAGVATTTLGFGSNFNEDLLIGMAAAGEGNFYFIESPDDAAGVFQIEVEGLASVAAQDLQAELKLAKGVRATVHNQYRMEDQADGLGITLGDVYGIEEKLLALELEIDAPSKSGPFSLGTLHYRFKCDVDGKLKEQSAELKLEVEINDGKIDTPIDHSVEFKVSPLRIAKIKNEAVSLADKGELAEASLRLRAIIDALKASPIVEKFEIAEELSQLEHYAERLEKRSFDGVLRKEMMDQAYQARNRNRSELNLRGTAGGSTAQLPAVAEPGTGVVLRCEKESGRLRIRVTSDGYDKALHVQFPRNIREEGASYVVESIVPSKDGSYYRATGKISLLLLPGQTRSSAGGSSRAKSGKASTVSCTAADLPTTNGVGDGVLIQCVKEGPKLRARVVSDGYDPNFNMRFPRSIREIGVLYVVDNVILGPGGNSYIACGDIKRLIQ